MEPSPFPRFAMGLLRSPGPAAVRPLSASLLMVRRTVFSTGLTTVPVLHRSGRIPGIGIKEPALIRRHRLAASTVLGRRRLRGVLQHADIALEFGAGQPAAAADVYRVEVAGLDECINGRASDTQQLGDLLWCQQERVAGRHVSHSLWIR